MNRTRAGEEDMAGGKHKVPRAMRSLFYAVLLLVSSSPFPHDKPNKFRAFSFTAMGDQ